MVTATTGGKYGPVLASSFWNERIHNDPSLPQFVLLRSHTCILIDSFAVLYPQNVCATGSIRTGALVQAANSRWGCRGITIPVKIANVLPNLKTNHYYQNARSRKLLDFFNTYLYYE
jgi:hypothetical protein